MSSGNAIALSASPSYGAVEIKEFIRKNTYRALIITLSLILLLFLLYGLYGTTTRTPGHSLLAPFSNNIWVNTFFPLIDKPEEIIPPKTEVIEFITEARAGTPVPIPDAFIRDDIGIFADIEQISKSLPGAHGQKIDIDKLPLNIEFGVKKIVPPEVEPNSEDISIVEKEPNIDLAELQRNVIYPEMARKVGVEGTVFIRVLVGKDGTVRQTKIEKSESSMLDQAAIDAVKKSVFTPAIQNGLPTSCWISIPIKFRLR